MIQLLVVVNHDYIHPSLASHVQCIKGRNTVVDGDDQRCTQTNSSLYAGGLQPVAIDVAIGQYIRPICSNGVQKIEHDSCARYAVYVIIAKHDDFFALANRLNYAFNSVIHVAQVCGIVHYLWADI